MDDITYSVPPGHHLNPVSVTLQFSPRVRELQLTTNGTVPAISKYIAYDTLPIPNPFLAVTQDGKGNVLYDGGFPKFYNNRAPAASVTTFTELTASFKYLYNALRFIENKTKRAMGNNKVLLVGDSLGSYNVEGTANNGFRTSFERLASVSGYQLTIKNRSRWAANLIDCTLQELEEYCCVIFMSSDHVASGHITERAIDAFVDYRENGNGLLFITDHGPNLTTIEQAKLHNYAAFFSSANRVVVNFGAWFSGTYDRTPVNVGFLRSTYGDHPLYNGMDDSESIIAGPSESRVFVAPFTPTLPSQVTPIYVGSGTTVIQIAAVLDSGEIVTFRAEYTVVSAKVSITDNDTVRDDGQVLDVSMRNNIQLGVRLDSTDMALFSGKEGMIYHNDQRIARVGYQTATGVTIAWERGDTGKILVNNGDTLVVDFSQVGLSCTVGVRRFQPPIKDQKSLAVVHSLLRTFRPDLTDIDRVKELVRQISVTVPWKDVRYMQNIPATLKQIVLYIENDPEYVNDPR